MAWTYLDATYRTNVCSDADCNGNRMPGIARNMGFASFGWQPEEGWYAGTGVRSRHERYHGRRRKHRESAVLYGSRAEYRV